MEKKQVYFGGNLGARLRSRVQVVCGCDDADGPGEVNYMVGIFWRENHGTHTFCRTRVNATYTHTRARARHIPVGRRRRMFYRMVAAGVV